MTDTTIDTKGLIYPRALQHLLTGVYLAEVCMIGLFGIAASIGPLVLMVVSLVGTVLFHIAMNKALDPLLYSLPKSLEAEEESLCAVPADEKPGSDDADAAEKGSAIAAPAPADDDAPHAKPNALTKFLMPHIYADYATLRRLVPHGVEDAHPVYEPETERDAYLPPTVKSATPLLWIPRDEMGVSRQEIAHTAKVIPITDEGAALDAKGNVYWDAEREEGARPPIWEEKVYY